MDVGDLRLSGRRPLAARRSGEADGRARPASRRRAHRSQSGQRHAATNRESGCHARDDHRIRCSVHSDVRQFSDAENDGADVRTVHRRSNRHAGAHGRAPSRLQLHEHFRWTDDHRGSHRLRDLHAAAIHRESGDVPPCGA